MNTDSVNMGARLVYLFSIIWLCCIAGYSQADNADAKAFNKFIIKQYQQNKLVNSHIEKLSESIAQLTYKLRQRQKDNQTQGQSELIIAAQKSAQKSAVKQAKTIAIGNKAYRDARNLLLSGQYKPAIKALSEYITLYPNSQKIADARFWLAKSYAATGQYDYAARKYLLFSVQHRSHYKIPNALYQLGISQYELGKKDKAILIFKSVLNRFPSHRIIALVKKSLSILEASKPKL